MHVYMCVCVCVYIYIYIYTNGCPGSTYTKEPAFKGRHQKRCRFNPWSGRFLELLMATHSFFPTLRIPWIENTQW